VSAPAPHGRTSEVDERRSENRTEHNDDRQQEIEREFASIAAPDYSDASGWLIVDWDARAEARSVDVFYVHPTAWAGPGWFADPLIAEVDVAVDAIAATHLGAFPGRVWAPRYRHATSRAFREIGDLGDHAYAAAYRDVERAFLAFIARTGDRPFILAGHSQGARHVLSLLADHVAGTPLLARLVVAYAPGVGLDRHTFASRFAGLELTGRPGSVGCVLSWNTFLDGADPSTLLSRSAGPIGCVNPLTFDAERPEVAGVRSSGGVLFVSPEVVGSLDSSLLPSGNAHGGNLHVLDIPLFRENIRADALVRIAAHSSQRLARRLTVRPIPGPMLRVHA
jgi:pimeloyl-ACP methyl ester carboxylesterase